MPGDAIQLRSRRAPGRITIGFMGVVAVITFWFLVGCDFGPADSGGKLKLPTPTPLSTLGPIVNVGESDAPIGTTRVVPPTKTPTKTRTPTSTRTPTNTPTIGTPLPTKTPTRTLTPFATVTPFPTF